MPERVEIELIRLRQVERWGRDELAAAVGVSPRTASRILARHSQSQLARLDPMTGELIRASKTTAICYERDRPGELVHMDAKKLGRIPDGGGWRSLGRDVTDRHRDNPVGFDYVHSLVDDHSRLVFPADSPTITRHALARTFAAQRFGGQRAASPLASAHDQSD